MKGRVDMKKTWPIEIDCPNCAAKLERTLAELPGVEISLSGLAVASLVGIILNAVLPGNDYKFGENKQGDEAVNFKV